MQGSPDSAAVAAPVRRDLDPAALELLREHGEDIMRTARRYAATPEDAEDAFQRAFEILLTQPPETAGADLVPWLKTVVRNEAYALHRARERQAPVTPDGATPEALTPAAITHDQAESRERGLQGAEALARLKPQEVRALVLKARGLTYREIGELESWSYTKVNRLLTEGRRAFRHRLAGIQAGAECERMEPLLSLLADGEATPEQLATLRPHLKTCLGCRARLREFRSTPDDVAALAPAMGGGGDGGRLRSLIESLLGIAHGKGAALAERAHALTEMATSQKLAAVAASAAAVAGGGAAVEEVASQPTAPPPPAAVVEQQDRAGARDGGDRPAIENAAEPAPATGEPVTTAATPPPVEHRATAPAQRRARDPANEFDPSGAAALEPAAPGGSGAQRVPEPGVSSLGAGAPGTRAQDTAPSAPPSAAGDDTPPGGGASGSPTGSGEFAP